MTDMQVVETIRALFGGSPAMYMIGAIGARNLVALGGRGGVQFQVMRNARGVTHVRIEPDASDTYRVAFLRVTRCGEIRELARFEGVYANSLRRIFEAETGLYLSL
nr:MAG: hypothetical protein DIU57_09610 [Pseudomonadota bacterium]